MAVLAPPLVLFISASSPRNVFWLTRSQPSWQTARACGESATLLGIIVGENHSLLRDAIDVGRPIAHHTHRIGADIGLPDVITENDENVWFLCLCEDSSWQD